MGNEAPSEFKTGSGSPYHGGDSAQASRVHRLLTLNSISNLARYFAALLIAFFLTPFIIKMLGDSVFGLWVVLLSFVGYASILELGVQPAVVKLVGQQRALNQTEKLQELTTTAFVFLGGVGLISGLLFFFVVPHFAGRIGGDEVAGSVTTLVFAVVAADISVLFLNYLFAGILYGCQLYPLKNFIDISGWVLNAALVLLFLTQGDLLALALCKLVTDVLMLLATVIACQRVLPGGFRLAVRDLRRSSFRELIGFGGKVFISATTSRIAVHAQPIIIGSAISSAAAAFFVVPVKLVDYSRQIVWAMATGFMPMFSELDSKNQRELLRDIYVRYTRYIILVTVPILVMIFVYGKSFIGLWIEPQYAVQGGTVLMLLTGAALVENLQPLIWRLFIGVGELTVLVRVSALASLATVALSIALVGRYGLEGVGVSVLLGAMVSQIFFAREACRYLELKAAVLIREVYLRPVPLGFVTYAAALGISRFTGQDSYGAMLLGGLSLLAVYIPLTFLGSLTGAERGWVKGKITRS